MNQFEPVQFVDADAQRIQQEVIDDFEKATGIVLYPGDPRRLFLLQQVPVIVALRNGINFTGNQNLLPFALDTGLDALGSRVGAERLQAQPARTMLRFTLSAVQPNPVTILKGTRVTPDGALYFSADMDLTIAAGETTGDVVAVATQGGVRYNDFLAGQINSIVDPVPFVSSVVNLDASSGGSDVESDEDYRERQRLAPASFSTAGPEDAYEFFAKSADVNIIDVAVTSPSAGVVNVYPLMEGGELPNGAVLTKVDAELNVRNRRPLTDQVSVLAPTAVNYDMTLTYYISKERSTEEAAIRAAIENTGGAIDKYEEWQHSKLGRAITPDDLISRMYTAGAYRVTAIAPVYTVIERNQFAVRVNPRSITYGGLI